MKTEADYDYEYYAFNEDPGTEIEHQELYLFDSPIRIFSTGPSGLLAAEEWVREGNAQRDEARRAERKGLHVDNVAGKLIQLEVRRRLIVKLGYEKVRPQTPRGLRHDAIEDVKANWVPA